jgi:hypothetical protein
MWAARAGTWAGGVVLKLAGGAGLGLAGGLPGSVRKGGRTEVEEDEKKRSGSHQKIQLEISRLMSSCFQIILFFFLFI